MNFARRFFHTLGLICALYTTAAQGILPLPYSIESEAYETPKDSESLRDLGSIRAHAELAAGSKGRAMELPAFGFQPNALGYEDGQPFKTPPPLRKRVDFWKRIYTEVSTEEALLHDYELPELTYFVVDLRSAAGNHRAAARLLKEEKRKLAKRLTALQTLEHTPELIAPEDLDLFRRFESIAGANKFLRAAKQLRAQVGQRDRIVSGFFYGGRYFPEMMRIFEAQGLPKELTRLPLVESAFNLEAKSKVGASGIWQFMRSTGKLFLHINRAVDERNDPLLATTAAAQLLAGNYRRLGSWPLAITAYNHGPEGMARAVRELASDDLAHIIAHYRSRSFGFASANFYSEFLAILEVEREHRAHFGTLNVDAPIQFDTMELAEELRVPRILESCELSGELFSTLNPGITDSALFGKMALPTGYRVRVPLGRASKCAVGAMLRKANT